MSLQMLSRLCLALLSLLLQCQGFQLSPYMTQLSDKYFEKEGDLNLGAIYHINQFSRDEQLCGKGFSFLPLHFNPHILAFEVETINKREDILPNVTLGYVALDDCEGQIPAIPRMVQLLPVTNTEQCSRDKSLTIGKNFDVVGILGTISSPASIVLATMTGFFQVPQIGAFASSDALSDKKSYPYFYSVIPPDRYQAKATVEFVNGMGWNYVSIVYVEADFGFNGNKNIRLRAREIDVCIEESYPVAMGSGAGTYKELIHMMQSRKAKILIVYLFPTMVRTLLTVYKQMFTSGELDTSLIWILPECFPQGMTRGLTDALLGSFHISLPNSEIPGFFDYYESITPWNNDVDPWLPMVWEQALSCSFDNSSNKPDCHDYKSLSESRMYFRETLVHRWGDAVHVYAHAIDALIRDRCPEAFMDKSLLKPCVKPWLLGDYIQNVEFQRRDERVKFTKEGEWIRNYVFKQVQYQPKTGRVVFADVAVYKTTIEELEIEQLEMAWDRERSVEPPDSKCSYPCGIGEIQIQGEVICCWDCHLCRENEIVSENGTKCYLCPQLYWPDETFSECLPIPVSYIDWSHIYGIGLLTLALIGFVSSCTVIILVIKHRDRRVIKGASPDMLAVILFGCILSCLSIPMFILKPTSLWCLLSRVGFSLSGIFMFAPQLVKTVRIYMVFAASERLETTVRFVSRTAINVEVWIWIFLQAVTVTVLGVLLPPFADNIMPIRSEKYVELQCDLDIYGIMIPLGYNILTILLCSVFGLLTRKLPDNFNESWYIFVTVCTTLFIWIACIPTYFVAFYAYHKAVLLALAMFLNAAIVLLCLFGPKIYALFYIKDKDIKITDFSQKFTSRSGSTQKSDIPPTI